MEITALPVLARTANNNFGLARVTVGDLMDARVAKDAFGAITKKLGIKKISLDAISLAFGLPSSKIELNKVVISPEQEDLANVISRSIEKEKDVSAREELWQMCDAMLKYQMLMPEIDQINVDLYSLLELDGDTVRKAFMKKVAYAKPKEGKTSVQYGEMDDFVAEQLKTILTQLPLSDAQELLLLMNPKVLYVLVMCEIEKFVGLGDSDKMKVIGCAFNYYDSVPTECVLLSWIQQHAPDAYKNVLYDIKNNEYPEMRSLFNEPEDTSNATERNMNTKLIQKYKDEKHEDSNELEEIIDSVDGDDKQKENGN